MGVHNSSKERAGFSPEFSVKSLMRVHALKSSLILMGLSGIVAQIVLLRELLVSFYGNELTIGIILANWLIVEAIGSYGVARWVEKVERKTEIYVSLQLVFSATFPFAIYLSRIFKNFLLATPGEAVGFVPIFYSSFLILLPVALPHGALFTFGCKLHAQRLREDASSIGKVYILETIGSIVGGLFVTFILIRYLHSFEIALAISLLNALISIPLLKARGTIPSSPLRHGLWALSIFFSLAYAFLLFTPASREIHLSSIYHQWRGLDAIHNENSIYGNITVTKRGEQYTFFVDGIPTITTPVPDVGGIEGFVHFAMLSHPAPQNVLILSGGAGGMIREILKHTVKRIDYVEIDPLLLTLVQRFPTPLTQSEFSDPRVRVHDRDGRFFIKKTKDRYDVIFIGLSAPQELQTNRLFSSEFFSIAKDKMNPGGIMVLSLPGSFTYVSPELRDLNGCILDTLKRVFQSVRIIPGDTNLYLASDSHDVEQTTPQELVRRMEERKIRTSLFTKAYIEYRLHERWLRWYLESMEGKKTRINSDFRPLAVFFNLSYWSALFSPYLTQPLKWFEGLSLRLTGAFTAIITLFLSFLFIKRAIPSRYALPYAIFTSGLADMFFDLAIIFTFQTLYGYLYYQIGLLVTVFMAGIAAGSLFVIRLLKQMRNGPLFFLITEFGFICFSFILPFVFSVPSGHLEKPIIYALVYASFLAMSFLCGFLVGLQFPLATKIYLDSSPNAGSFSHTAGLLYGADLLGGFFGGLLGGVLLLPILGLKESCFLIAIIKTSSLVLFLLFARLRK